MTPSTEPDALPYNVSPCSPAAQQAVADTLLACAQAGTPIAGLALDTAVMKAVAPRSIDLSALCEVREYLTQDLVITAETGLTFANFQAHLQAHGHDLSVRFPAHTRLADMVMLDMLALETGLKRGVKEVVLGLEVATPDGQVTKCGGKVVKNVTGYDLNKFYVGSQYALVVPTAVTLRLVARPEATRWWRVVVPSLAQAQALSQTLLAAPSVTLSALEWMPLAVAQALWPTDETLSQGDPAAWVGFVRSEGLAALVDWFEPQLQNALAGLSEPATSCQPWHPYQGDDVLDTLLPGLGCDLWLEAFLPYDQWAVLVADASLQWPVKPHRVQVRAAASVVSWQWEAGAIEGAYSPDWQQAVHSLRQAVEALGGYVRVMQAPVIDGPAFSWEAVFTAVNVPADPVVLGLNRQFKDRWDPTRTLFSRRLPL